MVRKCAISWGTVSVFAPLGIAVLLNALVRPWLGNQLAGVVVVVSSGVRGRNQWWTFDAATQAKHPLITSFLSLSDGSIALVAIGAMAAIMIARWIQYRRL